jgi:predicted nucleotidyltransferase
MKEDFRDRVVKCFKDYLGDNLLSIVLFGSHARGDAREESDYDLFIICKHLPDSSLKRIRFIRKPIVGELKRN